MKLDLSAPRYRILVPPSSSSPWREACSPPLGRVEAQGEAPGSMRRLEDEVDELALAGRCGKGVVGEGNLRQRRVADRAGHEGVEGDPDRLADRFREPLEPPFFYGTGSNGG